MRMQLKEPTRVNDILRGRSWPADEAQARALVEALGAVGVEVERGMRLYQAASKERDHEASRPHLPDWWLRSGYVGQVSDIAPIELLDRRAELDELAAWCVAGTDSYVWWQAPARAGKSALTAWFVLHPPAGVWVISFFVTARLASQADSNAFTDGLLDQLSAITGEQIPPITSAAQRDRLRRQLLVEAADRAAQAGKRLVLLVDGLDEDCGSQPGSGMASIASLLPKRPPDGLRVIAVGRPDPPIPADVVSDHPLRACPVRQLDPSPHAQKVAELARRELDEVLSSDPDGLGYQVLGLVTACGGGLDRHDLQELTGRAGFEIDGLLRGVFGRTVAGRTDVLNSRPVYLFTHETLRVEAIDRLGPVILAQFQERIRVWATGYQKRGWQHETPPYLLRSYARMLHDIGDVPGLAALATDSVRHDRMLAVTGGDAAALEEITAAQRLISCQNSPDMLTALRLARRRDHLTDRNAHVPSDLPAAWVFVGTPIRGEALARSITDSFSRARALAGVASAVAASQDHDLAVRLTVDAEDLARSVTHLPMRARVLADVASAVAAVGDHDRAVRLTSEAEELTRSITNPLSRVGTLTGVASAVAAAGNHDRAARLTAEAEEFARSITDWVSQENALADVAQLVASIGNHEQAEEIVRLLTSQSLQVQALAGVASVIAAAGDHDRAARLTAEAEVLARSIADPLLEAQALVHLTSAKASLGRHQQAEDMARSICDPFSRAEALAEVALALATAGDHDRAIQVATNAEAYARSTINRALEDRRLVDVSSALASIGDHQGAEDIARSITNQTFRAWALGDAALAIATAGDHDRAIRLSVELEAFVGTDSYHPALRQRILYRLVSTLALVGEHRHAEHLARLDTDPLFQSRALARVASAAAAAEDRDLAIRLTIDAEDLAGSIDRANRQAWALAEVASAVAVVGDHDRAVRLTLEAEERARSITDAIPRIQALTDVMHAAALIRDRKLIDRLIAEVQANLPSLGEPSQQAQALVDLSKAVDPIRAGMLIARALMVGGWTASLQAIARIDRSAVCTILREHFS